MGNIILFTNNCPRCTVLKKKLEQAKILYEPNYDLTEIEKKGIEQLPVLKVNNSYLDFKEAVKWVGENIAD